MVHEKALTEVFLEKDKKIMKINIPASLDFSWMLRDFIGSTIQSDTKFSQKWKHRLQLMADELINNAIEHWSAPWDPINICLVLYNNSDIEIIVEDIWTWKSVYKSDDLLAKAMLNREIMTADPTANRTIRWRWLAMIVLNWSDEFHYEDNDRWWLTAKILKKYSPDCADVPVNN